MNQSRLGPHAPPDNQAAFVGWRRLPKGRWRPVAEGETYTECLNALLDHAKAEGGSGECYVRRREQGPPS